MLTEIFRDDIDLAVWTRSLDARLDAAVASALLAEPTLKTNAVVKPNNIHAVLAKKSAGAIPDDLVDDLAKLVDMFCCLFDKAHAGLRLVALSGTLCPRFHIDHVACRLVTTYHGRATEWLPRNKVDRTQLGARRRTQSDSSSGLYRHASAVKQVAPGDVALFKGSLWSPQGDPGLVHRSPTLHPGEKRLLMSLDIID
ncbi:MAG: DUF1826 domain-containing protein [Pseudomonadota bacterium]